MPKLHIYRNEKETCHELAEWLTTLINQTLNHKDRFTIALSFTNIPKQFFKILVSDYTDRIPWDRIEVFLAEERVTADEKNNIKNATESFLKQLSIPKEHFHSIRTDLPPKEAALEYEKELKNYFSNHDSTFDLAILGLAEDGTILSLLPTSIEDNNTGAWVIPIFNTEEDLFRISITTPVVNTATTKTFLITGKRKEDIVQKALNGKYDPEKYLVQLIQTANKSVHWFLDETAANKIIKPTP